MKTNQEYKNVALAALKGKWAPAVVCTIVLILIGGPVMGLSYVYDMGTAPTGIVYSLMGSSFLVSLFVVYPLYVGYYNVFKDVLIYGEEKITNRMFSIAFTKVLRNGFGLLLTSIFVGLWTLLFIIPGIIKSFAYAMTPYILVDYPDLSPNQAINLSIKMMKGHKFDLFWLGLSFIGWGILSILTLGIGLFWLIPYVQTAMAAFYVDVKAEYEAKQVAA